MKKNIFLFGFLFFLALSIGFVGVHKNSINENNMGVNIMEEQIYQGPVQEGYDEQHFRLTGESKLLEIEQ